MTPRDHGLFKFVFIGVPLNYATDQTIPETRCQREFCRIRTDNKTGEPTEGYAAMPERYEPWSNADFGCSILVEYSYTKDRIGPRS
jgi:hypothetical protein